MWQLKTCMLRWNALNLAASWTSWRTQSDLATEATRPHFRCSCKRETVTCVVVKIQVHQITARLAASCCATVERLQTACWISGLNGPIRRPSLACPTVPHFTFYPPFRRFFPQIIHPHAAFHSSTDYQHPWLQATTSSV